ncbi:thioredoxin domain-containing protein [Rhodothermaceae bacterium RA]|nr:thioredoxin domain-containing protein [Rhodothermaceae bacterium RA]
MPNRLAGSDSPYLLQHRDNPVDWFPWGDEAFEKARREDKPVFLSIGYATCHWCHVMAHESFEDPEVAALLNEGFVSIKVDREERPDIDQIYMTVCQLATGQGGWPLTVVMTPDKRPFFVATYLPKRSRLQRIGMMELLPRLRAAWETNRAEVLAAADDLTGVLRQMSAADAGGEQPGRAWLDAAFGQLARRYDPEHGGFGQAPKFPSPHHLLFLLRYTSRTGRDDALRMVTHTLDRMRMGGIYDHVGFGFHRYATDRTWTLPHFEKMLYDQAMLSMAYTEAYQATGRLRFRRTAEEILTYVLRDLTDPEGGFYSAEDADSEGREGAFYLWTVDELRAVLGEDDARRAIEWFNVEPRGNFEEEATRRRTGENVLFRRPASEEASDGEADDGEAGEQAERLEAIRRRLFAAREQRPRPLRDDKILTDWNGLMIAALALAGRVLEDARYTGAAARAVGFIRRFLWREDGRLWHRYRQGHAGLQANLDDYAFLCWGLLECYETTFEPRYLREAVQLAEQMIALFEDAGRGGFFFTPSDGEPLLIRPKEPYDNAYPSGHSVAVLVLIRLARMLGRPAWEDRAIRAARAYGEAVRRHPSAFTALLTGLDLAIGPSAEVVIAGDPAAADTQALLTALRRPYLPRKVVMLRPADDAPDACFDLAPYLVHQRSLEGRATAYVCRNLQCDQPTTDPAVMLARLQEAPA